MIDVKIEYSNPTKIYKSYSFIKEFFDKNNIPTFTPSTNSAGAYPPINYKDDRYKNVEYYGNPIQTGVYTDIDNVIEILNNAKLNGHQMIIIDGDEFNVQFQFIKFINKTDIRESKINDILLNNFPYIYKMKTINHSALVNLYNKDKTVFTTLFKDTNTLSKLSNKIIKLSKSFTKFAYIDADKLKGDVFEIFAESFFKILSADNRIGVYNYNPAPAIDDFGVDGTGTGMNDLPLTVQVKFRSDATTELKETDIKQFAFQSIINHKVDQNTKTNMIVFTNAKGLHWVTKSRVFSGRVRALGFQEISQLVDNNSVFWKDLNDLIEDTIKVRYK